MSNDFATVIEIFLNIFPLSQNLFTQIVSASYLTEIYFCYGLESGQDSLS